MKNEFEAFLASLIEENYIVDKAMNYSLLAKSKRLRPLLLLNTLKDLGLDYKVGFEAAAALEMVHTYSLIHDDLPAFDNDDYRRGLLTNHKVFGEDNAILAGDALLTKAFETLTVSENYDAEVKIQLVYLLADYAGHKGMIKGQAFDQEYENKKADIDKLTEIENLKTSKLLTAPFIMALAIAKKADDYFLFTTIGSKLGIAFQIQDDLLDVLSSKEVTGKSNSDVTNNKSTYVSLLGVEQAKAQVDKLYNEIYDLLGEDYHSVKELIKSMQKRVW